MGNGTLVLENSLLDDGYIYVKEGIITEITRKTHTHKGLPFIDARGGYISPGLVELHIHGCGEYSFETIDKQGMEAVCRFLREYGVTHFLPTLQCDESAVCNLAGIIVGPGDDELFSAIRGTYIEGPFVNPEKRGGILEQYVSPPDPEYLYKLLDTSRYLIKMMTVAPEVEAFDTVLQPMLRMGIVPCLGHSLCTVNETDKLREFAKRFRIPVNITHLFNAMGPFSHKTSGLSMLPFLDSEVYVELNGDGIHLNKAALRMCYRHVNHDRLILISDAVVTAGLPIGSSQAAGKTYFGKRVVSGAEGVRYEDSNILVGSNRVLTQVMRNFMETTGADLPETVRFASLNPHRLLGTDTKFGSIEIGKEGDLVVLDRDYFSVL